MVCSQSSSKIHVLCKPPHKDHLIWWQRSKKSMLDAHKLGFDIGIQIHMCTDTQSHFSKPWTGITFYFNFVMCFWTIFNNIFKTYLTTQKQLIFLLTLRFIIWTYLSMRWLNISYPELARYQSSVCSVHMTNMSEWLRGTALWHSTAGIQCSLLLKSVVKVPYSRLKIWMQMISTLLMTTVSQYQINSHIYYK